MPIVANASNVSFSKTNSTMTPLGANETYYGAWEDVSQFAIIYTLWRTDAYGTLYYEFSIDATAVDRVFTLPSTDVINGTYVATGPRGRYFRIRFVNGPVAQTLMRLQTTYSSTKSDDAHSPPSFGVSPKSNSLVTRSVMFGQTPSATYAPLKVTADGQLTINTNAAAALSPTLKTNKLITESVEEDQVVLAYTPDRAFSLYGWSTYVWDTVSSANVVFGEASLESPIGTKLYTTQLSSMGLGKDLVTFTQPLIFPANQTLRIVCSPSAPVVSQTWQGNLVGAI